MIDPDAERPHPPGSSSAWTETWELRLASPTLDLATAIAVVQRPAEGQVSYLGAVLGRDRPPVVVLDHDIPIPRTGLELRSSGIWADHVCETPHEHWSVGLEAFALELDEPDDLITVGRGHSIPLGFDLEWETPTAPVPIRADTDDGYFATGFGHGEILLGDQTLEIEGPGHRLHRWGTGPALAEWWADSDDAGWGQPPRPVAALARVSVADHNGSVVELQLGPRLDPDGPGPRGWSTLRIASP